jgi:uncharacterized protein YbjT (DUF2867 family)
MILVTGSTGTIGSATVQALRSQGARFKVATRSSEKAKSAGGELVHFDWDDFSSYLPALEGIEKLFLLTPVGERQLGYVLQLVAAAKRAKVRHIVKLSAIGVDLEPGLSILRIHRYAETELEKSGIPWTFLRPTFFMQNFTNFHGVSPKKDTTIYLPQGTGKATWIDGRDVGEVAAKVLTSPGHENKAYTLTGREVITTAEALAILSRIFGRQFNYVDVPEEAARQHLEGTGLPLWLVDGFLELSWLVKSGNSGEATGAVKQILGREPRTLEEWAKQYVRGEVMNPA